MRSLRWSSSPQSCSPGRSATLGGKRGLALYLGLWAIVFPIQTIVVNAENPDDIVVSYFVVNALILALGIGLNRLGARLRTRREQKAVSVPM